MEIAAVGAIVNSALYLASVCVAAVLWHKVPALAFGLMAIGAAFFSHALVFADVPGPFFGK